LGSAGPRRALHPGFLRNVAVARLLLISPPVKTTSKSKRLWRDQRGNILTQNLLVLAVAGIPLFILVIALCIPLSRYFQYGQVVMASPFP
jgi:hypothetical protein